MSVRMLRRPAPVTAFVLGGGGNLGAVQVGMLRALFECAVAPDLLVGCSVGALNAAGLAGDPSLGGVEHMWDVWAHLDGDELWPAGRISGLWQLGRKGHAIQPNTGLRDLIERAIPYRTFEESRLPVQVVATSLTYGRARWFSSGSIAEPVLASAALPAVFPPVIIDGEPYIDGGVVDNVPISRAIALGATRVYVLHPPPHRRAALGLLHRQEPPLSRRERRPARRRRADRVARRRPRSHPTQRLSALRGPDGPQPCDNGEVPARAPARRRRQLILTFATNGSGGSAGTLAARDPGSTLDIR